MKNVFDNISISKPSNPVGRVIYGRPHNEREEIQDGWKITQTPKDINKKILSNFAQQSSNENLISVINWENGILSITTEPLLVAEKLVKDYRKQNNLKPPIEFKIKDYESRIEKFKEKNYLDDAGKFAKYRDKQKYYLNSINQIINSIEENGLKEYEISVKKMESFISSLDDVKAKLQSKIDAGYKLIETEIKSGVKKAKK